MGFEAKSAQQKMDFLRDYYRNLTRPSAAKYELKNKEGKICAVTAKVSFKLGQVDIIVITDSLEGVIYEFKPPTIKDSTVGKLKVTKIRGNEILPINEKMIDSLKTHLEKSAAAFKNKVRYNYIEEILLEIAGRLYDMEIIELK